jgi:hypothetical protein
LTRFEAIGSGRNGTDVIRHRETNEFFVDEFGVWDFLKVMVQKGTRLDVKHSSLA